MNKAELKKILKPLIKECVKDVLFEDGVLSGVISEVVRGVQPQAIINQPPQKHTQLKEQKVLEENRKQMLTQRHEAEKERRKKLLDATGFKDLDIFEGTEPMTSKGEIRESNSPAAQGPLSGVAPNDAGIDISGILAAGNSQNWKKLARGK
jgi:hypothetical protein